MSDKKRRKEEKNYIGLRNGARWIVAYIIMSRLTEFAISKILSYLYFPIPSFIPIGFWFTAG